MASDSGSKKGPAGPSQRQLRAGELVRRALIEVMARDPPREPELEGVSVTVGEVRMSPDLRHAHCYVAALGKEDPEQIARGMGRAARYLRGRIGARLEMRFTPELHFIPDDSYNDAQRMHDVIANAAPPRPVRARAQRDEDDED